MSNRFSAKKFPLLAFALAGASFVGCGGEEYSQLAREVVTTKAAQLNQADLDSFTNAIKLKNCTFVVAAGSGTFTPSDELSQAIDGDPHGSAHKVTFAVPPITAGTTTVELTSLVADMANTGITLSGTTSTVRLAFHGQLHIDLTAPVVGKISADIEIRPSYLDAALSYDKASEREKATAVTTHFDVHTKNCGAFGWCNGIIDGVLKSNLAGWVETPLRDALTKGLDSTGATDSLDALLTAGYNLKDHQATPWSMVAHSLSQAAGAFSFTAQRTTP